MSNTQKLAYSFVSIHDVFTDRHECTAYTQRHRQSSEMIFCHRSLEINENSWPLPERNFFRINISGFGCLVPAIGDNGQPLSVLPCDSGFGSNIYFKHLFLFLRIWSFQLRLFWGFVLLMLFCCFFRGGGGNAELLLLGSRNTGFTY